MSICARRTRVSLRAMRHSAAVMRLSGFATRLAMLFLQFNVKVTGRRRRSGRLTCYASGSPIQLLQGGRSCEVRFFSFIFLSRFEREALKITC